MKVVKADSVSINVRNTKERNITFLEMSPLWIQCMIGSALLQRVERSVPFNTEEVITKSNIKPFNKLATIIRHINNFLPFDLSGALN